jgi:translation initiation factor IF-3
MGQHSGQRAAIARGQSAPPETSAAQQQQQQSRINQQIRASELMVVFPDGTKQVGMVNWSRHRATQHADRE